MSAGAGTRAPDATGLTRDAVTGPLRLFSLLGRGHTLLLHAREDAGPADVERFERAARATATTAHGQVAVYLIAAPGANVATTVLPLIRDSGSEFARTYATRGDSMFVRPDGYLGFAGTGVDALVSHLRTTFT